LLEEINIRNCTNVATLDLSNNPLIKKVYAAGSGATAIIFPNGGVLNTIEYSAVTGNITILNQKGLTNFIYENSENNNYSALTKLWVENTPNVPVVDIINKHMSGLTSGIRLTGLDINLYSGAST
jgi:nitrous oxidase accessory protein NosD